MADKSAPLLEWPWKGLGNWKYILFGPLLAKSIYDNIYGGQDRDNFCFHILLVSFLRYNNHHHWQMFSRMLFLTKRLQVRSTETICYSQIDREWHWDNPFILQALLATTAHSWLPFFSNLPVWNGRGIVWLFVLHALLAEPLFYWIHRAFHSKTLFAKYHSLHHASVTTEPATAGTGSFLEQLVLVVVMAVPLLGNCLLGNGSIGMLYVYLLAFDSLRDLGHCNVEIIPSWPFRIFPPLKYIIYTPSTMDMRTASIHMKLRKGRKERPPDFVFLVHVIDLSASLHAPFVFAGFASLPYSGRWFIVPFVPLAFLAMGALWLWGSNIESTKYYLRDNFHELWCVPRYGFQYFIHAAKKGINNHIEAAILDAEERGVKVIGLAALNKSEGLNGGGAMFVDKHPNLKVRVVHGNTLTAAVIVNEIPKEIREVFITASTSKLGRAIALYLCRKGVRVLMLTGSRERFQSIVKDAPQENRQNLVHVTKHEAAKHCKTWIAGTWLSYSQQKIAPPGTHFHQFVVPSLFHFRRDCTYGSLAAMRLPQDVKGLFWCEYTLGRGIVHACHAGGVVHCLEKWNHHEVGAIDVDKIDVVWEAALRQGFKTV